MYARHFSKSWAYMIQVERTWDLVRDSGQRKLTYSSQNHCTSSRSVYLSRRLNSHWERFVITHHLQKWESQLRLRWRILSVHSYCSKPHIRIDIQPVNKRLQLRFVIRLTPDQRHTTSGICHRSELYLPKTWICISPEITITQKYILLWHQVKRQWCRIICISHIIRVNYPLSKANGLPASSSS